MKAQTAMDYLMTYGWAILIVIVVIAALYSMGVFSEPFPSKSNVCKSLWIITAKNNEDISNWYCVYNPNGLNHNCHCYKMDCKNLTYEDHPFEVCEKVEERNFIIK